MKAKSWLGLLAFGLLAVSCKAQVKAYRAEEILQRLKNEDTIYVVNFWATWCGPCVVELPYFENVNRDYAGKPVKVLLISLDFKEDYPFRLSVFLKNKKIESEVLWLNEKKPNDFIPKFSKQWGGAIPATIISYGRKNYRQFFERPMRYYELETIVNEMLK